MIGYTFQLLVPILLGIALGQWLHLHYGLSILWTAVLAVLGMVAGVVVVAKEQPPIDKPEPKNENDLQKKDERNHPPS